MVAGLFLLLWAILSPHPAAAEGLEVTPILGYSFGGDFDNSRTGETVNFAESESYGLILSLPDQSKYGGFYELLYLRQPTRLKEADSLFSSASKLDVDINYLHLGGSYSPLNQTVNPYVAAGIGLTHMRPEQGEAETRFSFSVGGGIKVPLTERIGLRLEGRGFATLFNGRGTIFCNDDRCDLHVHGDLLWQFTTFGGIVFRF